MKRYSMINTLLGKRLKKAIKDHEKASSNLKEITDRYTIKKEQEKPNGEDHTHIVSNFKEENFVKT